MTTYNPAVVCIGVIGTALFCAIPDRQNRHLVLRGTWERNKFRDVKQARYQNCNQI